MEIFASYSGSDFLVFYAVMLFTCVIAGLWIPANLRPEGRGSDASLDMEEIAVLASGTDRHALAVSADLMARDALQEGEKKRVRVRNANLDVGTSGSAILREVGDLQFKHIKKATQSQAQRIEQQLVRRGLIMEDGDQMKLRLISILPYAVLFAIGFYRQQAGSAQGEPTGFLIALMIVTLVFAAIRFFKHNKRTMAGNEVIRDLEASSDRLRRAPNSSEAGFAVALFGTAVLVGTPWEPVHAMRNAAGADGGGAFIGDGGGDSGGDGASGCGGGCGGCGG